MSDIKQDMETRDPDSKKVKKIIEGMEKWQRDGDLKAYNLVFDLVYEDLRRIAGQLYARESRLEMSRATSIVNRLYERWLNGKPFTVSTQKELLGFANHAMKQLYKEKGRKAENRQRLRPTSATGDLIEVVCEEKTHNSNESEIFYQELESKLKKKNEKWYNVWKLKSKGYTFKEIAAMMDQSVVTTKRHHEMAKTFLTSFK